MIKNSISLKTRTSLILSMCCLVIIGFVYIAHHISMSIGELTNETTKANEEGGINVKINWLEAHKNAKAAAMQKCLEAPEEAKCDELTLAYSNEETCASKVRFPAGRGDCGHLFFGFTVDDIALSNGWKKNITVDTDYNGQVLSVDVGWIRPVK